MAELILHHYWTSLFSEKARAMLNARGLAWRSVIIPPIMPRPDTIPLTGGYRRTPVLQVGADVYCDTALIAAYLDEVAADRGGHGQTFFPAEHRLAASTLARWVDTELFWASVTLRFQPENSGSFFADPAAAQVFWADRAKFSEGSTVRRLPLEESLPRYRRFLAELEAQLGDGRTQVFGGEWTIADFSIYHVLWFVHAGGAMAELLGGHPAVKAFFERMRRFGATKGEPLDPAQALLIAAESEPAPVEPASDLAEIPVGALVDVAPTDYGVMPTRGELLRCDDATVVIRRAHERTGVVNVHFPRHGFGVTRA